MLLLTRFDFGFLAARGYIDIPYMALVMWAAVLEARAPRRGAPVLVLLALAGMLRPEAWVLAGLYWLWVAWRASWRQRALYAALAALGPLVWTATDFIVTGDPLFSLLYTSGSAEDLGRQRTLAELPTAIPGVPEPDRQAAGPDRRRRRPAAGGGAGAAARGDAARAVRRPAWATFVLIGVAGASVIERYLVDPGGRAARLRRRVRSAASRCCARARCARWWTVGAALLVLFGVVFTATRVRSTTSTPS